MVAFGETVTLPEGTVTLPIPLFIVIEVAEGAFQLKVADCPGAIAAGEI